MGDTAATVAGLRRQWGLGLVLLGVGVPLGQPLILFVIGMTFGVLALWVLAVVLVAWGIEVVGVRRSSVRRPHARVGE